MGKMKICIVIPVYNEKGIIDESIRTILPYLKNLSYETKLVVVNDGSTDGTKRIIEEITSGNDDLELITHITNRGYGAAICTGIRFAIKNNYDYTVFMDSDLTNHPKYLKDFYAKIGEGWEYIKATRYSKGGEVKDVPFNHRIISKVGNFIAKILYGIPLTDLTNGFRAVKVDILRKIEFKEKTFVIIMEELYEAKYLTGSFCDIPYVLTSRQKWQGKTHFSYSLEMCMKYFSYAWKAFTRNGSL